MAQHDINALADPGFIWGSGPTSYPFKGEGFDDFDDLNYGEAVGGFKWLIHRTDPTASFLLDADAEHGILEMIQAANDDDVMGLFGNSGFIAQNLEPNMPLRFGARFKVTDADDCDVHIGLGVYDESYKASVPNDYAAFRLVDGDTDLDIITSKDGTIQSSTGIIAVADDTWVRAFFEFLPTTGNRDSGTLRWTVHSNGVVVNGTLTLSNSFPDDIMIFPFVQFQNGAAAADKLSLDWIYARGVRASTVDGTG